MAETARDTDRCNEGEAMKLFYTFLLHWTQFDIAVARSTGRGQHFIAALLEDEARWERALWDLQHPLNVN